MTTDGGKRRAAAVCEHCGSCHVVRVRPDGSVRVIGTNGTCACGESDYRLLGEAKDRNRDAASADVARARSREA